MYKHSILLLVLVSMIWACKETKKEQSPENDPSQPNTTNTQKVDSAAIVKPQIEQILSSYYSDLSAENIDESKYFAPTVSAFFASQNIPATKVGESLRQGFKTMDNRTVVINPASTVVSKTANGYEVEIQGTSEHTDAKSKKQIKGDFHNLIVFDNNLKIVSYTKAESSRGLGAETEMDFAQKIMDNLNSANAIEQFIDAEKGVLYMYRLGVFDHITSAKDYQTLKTSHEQIESELRNLGCKSLEMREVAFDCDKGFKEKGCFLSAVEGYNDFSEKTRALNSLKGGPKKYSAKEMSQEKEMEAMVTHQLVITEKYLLLGLGKINGKWCVITIDTAKFDCSA